LKLPVAVGVPETFPEVRSRFTPCGICPEVTAKLYGDVPPLAVTLPLYPEPSVPVGRLAEIAKLPLLPGLRLAGFEGLPQPLRTAIADKVAMKTARLDAMVWQARFFGAE